MTSIFDLLINNLDLSNDKETLALEAKIDLLNDKDENINEDNNNEELNNDTENNEESSNNREKDNEPDLLNDELDDEDDDYSYEESIDSNNTDNNSSNKENEQKKQLHRILNAFYNTLCLSENTLLNSELPSDENNIQLFYNIKSKITESKNILFDIITEELYSKPYDETLKKYKALEKMYDICLQNIQNIFSDTKQNAKSK